MRILILGANGRIARIATDLLLSRSEIQLNLFLRKAVRLEKLASDRVSVIGGDALDAELLEDAMVGCDVVYANLCGPHDEQARCIVKAMTKCGVKRLIFMCSTDIVDEAPDKDIASSPLRNAERHRAAVIEASSLDYTVLRPRLPGRHAPVDGASLEDAGHSASRKAVANLVVKMITTPGLHVRRTLGVDHGSPSPATPSRSARQTALRMGASRNPSGTRQPSAVTFRVE